MTDVRDGVASRRRVVVSMAGVAAATVAFVVPMGSAGAVEPLNTAPSSGTWNVVGHGNGHGHGLSQWGAYARASAGQSTAAILAFYYANTSLSGKSSGVAATPIRVLLSRTGSYLTVKQTTGLSVSGVGSLSGADAWRLVPYSTSALSLQSLTGSTWTTRRTGLASGTAFSSSAGSVSVVRSDSTTASYRGSLRGVRDGSSVDAVNVLGLDDYVRGVAPNESPASWPTAAVQSQVIAARTYALFEVRNEAGSGTYDICDTTSCQVYGGLGSEQAATNDAVTNTAGQIVTYNGAPIFAQFSSSNGGWTFDGGKPYLIARQDTYDTASADPWHDWKRSVQVSDVAQYYGFSSVSAIQVTARNGNGDWGGAVTGATVYGTKDGTKTSVQVSGDSLRWAMSLPMNWFTIVPTVPLALAPLALSAQLSPTSAALSWRAPQPNGASAIQGYQLAVSGRATQTLAASATSFTLGSLTPGTRYTVTLRAVTAEGAGAPATLDLTPTVPPNGAPAPLTGTSTWPGHWSGYAYWTVPADPAVTGYAVAVAGRKHVDLARSATSTTFTSLTDGVAYSIYLRAVNAAGESNAVVLAVVPAPVPDVPTSVKASATTTSATVTWGMPLSNNTPGINAFVVARSGRPKSVVSVSTRSLTFTGLTPGTVYRIDVRARNSAGEGPAATVTVKTPAS